MYSVRKLVGLPVVTESGTRLGWLFDIALSDKANVVSYTVRTKRFGGKELVVAPSQVISVSDIAVTVMDTTTVEPVPSLTAEAA